MHKKMDRNGKKRKNTEQELAEIMRQEQEPGSGRICVYRSGINKLFCPGCPSDCNVCGTMCLWNPSAGLSATKIVKSE